METALIIIVGNNINRAIKTIETVSPKIVYFILTEKYRKYLTEILKVSEPSFETRRKFVKNFQNIEDTYNVSKEIFEELKNENKDVYVGISNGTKAMISGLVLASVAYDCELIYFGSDSEGRDENGEVKEGHEKMFPNFNPMKKQAILEISKGKRFFNKYQFDEAIKNFEIAKNVLDNKKLVDIYINLATLYKYWDKFDIKVIYNHPKRGESSARLNYFLTSQILNEIDNNNEIKKYFLNKEKLFYDQLKCNEIFLNNKIYDVKKPFIDKDNIFYYLVDLMNNASRRIDEKKFDDATARLYRTCELIAQIRLLNNYNLIDETRLKDNSVFHINKLNLIESDNLDAISYVESITDFHNIDKKTVRLSLNQDYELLRFFGDELAENFLKDNIKNALSNRNNSILAHGLNPADEDDAIDFLKGVEKYARENSIVDSYEFDKYYEYSKFPKFKDIEL